MKAATLVDSNVLIDVFGGSDRWASRAADALAAAANAGPLVINQVIYAEIAVRYEDTDELIAPE